MTEGINEKELGKELGVDDEQLNKMMEFKKRIDALAQSSMNHLYCIRCGKCCDSWETIIPKNSDLFNKLSSYSVKEGLIPFSECSKIAVTFYGHCEHKKKDPELGCATCGIYDDKDKPSICSTFKCWDHAPLSILQGLNFALTTAHEMASGLTESHPELYQIIVLSLLYQMRNALNSKMATLAKEDFGSFTLEEQKMLLDITDDVDNNLIFPARGTKCDPVTGQVVNVNVIPTFKERTNIDYPSKRYIGRNEKCPCGSGKKYKKCCGR